MLRPASAPPVPLEGVPVERLTGIWRHAYRVPRREEGKLGMLGIMKNKSAPGDVTPFGPDKRGKAGIGALVDGLLQAAMAKRDAARQEK